MLAEQGLLEPVAGVSVGLWHQVAVAVEGDLDGRVPELLADVLRVLALGDQERGERVPQVVEADLRQASPAKRRLELAPDNVAAVERPTGIREHELVLARERTRELVLPQRPHERRR